MEFTVFSAASGYAALVSDGKALVKFYLPVENNNDAVNTVLKDFPGALERETRLLKEARELVKSYFAGVEVHFNRLPVFISNMSDFAKKVMDATSEIQYGLTRTYKWVAGQAGDKDAARAVGNVLNRNPLPVIIPCHRVILSGGEIGGYSAGLQWKLKLLQIEKTLK